MAAGPWPWRSTPRPTRGRQYDDGLKKIKREKQIVGRGITVTYEEQREGDDEGF
jgi:hypothetical protein